MLLFRAAEGTAETYLLSDGAANLRAVYKGKVAPYQVDSIIARLARRVR